MKIPYVIDNVEHRLADVINAILHEQPGRQVDIATAYFSTRGYQQVRHTLPAAAGVRLLLGAEPRTAADVGLQPDSAAFLRHELNAEPLTESTQRLVEELIRFLRRPSVQVRRFLGHEPGAPGRRAFLHAKCYLFYGGPAGQGAYLNPLVGIVGSSNFTGPGLLSNRELNLVHKTVLAPDEVEDALARLEVAQRTSTLPALAGLLAEPAKPAEPAPDIKHALKSEVGARAIIDLAGWYDAQWHQAVDFKDDFIALLENSKFGGREYTPYEIYMKALYEYFKDDLDAGLGQGATRSAVELTEFQEDAVKKARRILARYDGVVVADSVGLGKTWIGKKLLEDTAYHLRQKALVICPASLRAMWEHELRSAAIAGAVLTQERLGQESFDPAGLEDVDVILIDEAHNFRNRRTQRYANLELLLAANGRRGRDGGRKKLILLTATPINNNIFDLYNQINLFTGNDRTYFAAAGIGDLYNYFLAARRDSLEQGSIRVFNLLEEVVVRRTRQFIRRAYPDAAIAGRRITWPERRLRTVRYDLEDTYEGFYREIMRRIETLHLAHYNLESYKRPEEQADEFELGREQALVGIFKSRFLKRLESSIEAFRISVARALAFAKTFAEYLHDDIVLDSSSFQTALRLLAGDEEDADAAGGDLPASLADAIDASEEARQLVAHLPRLDAGKYDRRRLHHALQQDIDALTDIWYKIKAIGLAEDAKLQRLRELLAGELAGQKVLIFTTYKDTARYVQRGLAGPEAQGWLAQAGSPHIRRIDGRVKPEDRVRLVQQFAPVANGRPEAAGGEREIDILVATDVLSEGQNLQDCGVLVNYDLHWNPTRMVQRAGRIDRLGSPFPVLTIHNLFPEKALEDLLGLVQRLTAKIDVINQAGFLDASVLGEVVTPRDFNTLRRIAAEDNSVIDEQEAFLELASSEAMQAELQRVLASEAARWITDLDDGIHSGLQRPPARGIFFYFTAPHADGGRQHFWRYYDAARRQIVDNRYQIMQLIACGPETPRFPPPYHELDVYQVQDKVIEAILADVAQQQAAAIVDKPVAEEQNIASQILRQHLNTPGLERAELKQLRAFLKQPLVGAAVARLRQAVQQYSATGDVAGLVETVRTLAQQQAPPAAPAPSARPFRPLGRDDLHLVCYEYLA